MQATGTVDTKSQYVLGDVFIFDEMDILPIPVFEKDRVEEPRTFSAITATLAKFGRNQALCYSADYISYIITVIVRGSYIDREKSSPCKAPGINCTLSTAPSQLHPLNCTLSTAPYRTFLASGLGFEVVETVSQSVKLLNYWIWCFDSALGTQGPSLSQRLLVWIQNLRLT